MRSVKEIASFFTTTKGIIVGLSAILITGYNSLAWYNGNVIRNYNKENAQKVQIVNIDRMLRNDTLEKQRWESFLRTYKAGRESDSVRGVKILRSLTVLDTAMQRHLRNSKLTSEYIQLLKDQVESEKKNNTWLTR